MKVLLIAEAANPEWVSVPLVGWSQAEALMKKYDCLLVTQVRNREAILRKGYKEGLDFIAIDSEKIARPIDKLGKLLSGGSGKGWTTKMAFSYISYIYFEKLVWDLLSPRIKADEFDVIHRITPLSPTQPSFIAKKCARQNVPFVIGPLNGGLPWPKEFNKERKLEREWLSYIRGIYKLLPGYRATRENSAKIIIGSKATWNQVEKKYHSKCVYLPENGIDPKRFSRCRNKEITSPVQAVFVGRLVPYKGVKMLLEGFQKVLKLQQVRLDIIGDGPERESLERLAAELGVTTNIQFHGWVAHENVQDYLVNADILAFPSIREFGGGVVLEAMALGVMPMIVNYGGPSELATQETGVLIDMGNRQQITERLQSEIEKLVQQPEVIQQKGRNARAYVLENYTWEKKAEQIGAIYQTVIAEKR